MSDLEIQTLEAKIAFLERHVEEQDREILRLNGELSSLAKSLTALQERFKEAMESGKNSLPQERPPHY